MTIREEISAILTFLKQNAARIGVSPNSIDFGQSGEMPAEAPLIWLFIEINNNEIIDYDTNQGCADAILFCVASSDTTFDAMMSALEIAERCYKLMISYNPATSRNVTYEFDMNYANYSVAYVKFPIFYEKADLLELEEDDEDLDDELKFTLEDGNEASFVRSSY